MDHARGEEGQAGPSGNLDMDMPQYIHDNTDDEFSHHDFLNAYLEFIGAKKVDLQDLEGQHGGWGRQSKNW